MRYRHEFQRAPAPASDVRLSLLPLSIFLLVGAIVFAVFQTVALHTLKKQQWSAGQSQIGLQNELKAIKAAKAVVEKKFNDAQEKTERLKTELTSGDGERGRLQIELEASTKAQSEALTLVKELKEHINDLNSRFDDPISAEERKAMQGNELVTLKKQVEELQKELSRKAVRSSEPK